jgi:hypothetical protein
VCDSCLCVSQIADTEYLLRSGNGVCLAHGICRCNGGFFGVDCSTAGFSVDILNSTGLRQVRTVPNLQIAVSSTVALDVLMLMPKIFSGPGNRDIALGDRSLTIRGAGPLETVIDCGGDGQGFSIDSSHADPGSDIVVVIEDLAVKNGAGRFGGGILINGTTVHLQSVNIQHCTAELGGGGVYLMGGTATMVETIVSHNKVLFALAGGGLSLVTSRINMSSSYVFANMACGTGVSHQCTSLADEVQCARNSSTTDRECSCCNGCHKPLPALHVDAATIVKVADAPGIAARAGGFTIIARGSGLAYGNGGKGQKITTSSVAPRAGATSEEANFDLVSASMLVFHSTTLPSSMWLRRDDGSIARTNIYRESGVTGTLSGSSTENGGSAILRIHLKSPPQSIVSVSALISPIVLPGVVQTVWCNASIPYCGAGLRVHPQWSQCPCRFVPATTKPGVLFFDSRNWDAPQTIEIVGQNDGRYLAFNSTYNVTIQPPNSDDIVYSAANVPPQHFELTNLAFTCKQEGETPDSTGTSCICNSGWEMAPLSRSCSRCRNGFYKPSVGNHECTPCSTDPAAGAKLDTAGALGSVAANACKCRPGHYRSNDACQLCKEGANCTMYDVRLNDVPTLPGFWRPSRNSTDFIRCTVVEQCIGGLDTEQMCLQGSGSIMCQTCSPGYAMYTRCERCDEAPVYISIVALVIFYIVLTYTLLWHAVSGKRAQDESGSRVPLMKVLLTFLLTNCAVLNAHDGWHGACTCAFCRLGSHLGLRDKSFVFVGAVGAMVKVEQAASTVALVDMPVLQCLFALSGAGGEARYAWTVFLYSLLSVLVLVIPAGIIWIRKRCMPSTQTMVHPDSKHHDNALLDMQMRADSTVATAIVIMYFMYPSVVRAMAWTFRCVDLYDGPHLVLELSIACDSDVYTVLFVVSAAGLLLVGIGLPLSLFSSLFCSRKQLHGIRVQRRFSFIYFGYTAKLWWWEAVITIRKLCCIIIPLTTNGDTAERRVASMAAVILCFLYAHLYMQPMVDEKVSFAETSSMCVSLLSSAIVILLPPGAERADHDWWLPVLLVSVNVLYVGWLVVAILGDVLRTRIDTIKVKQINDADAPTGMLGMLRSASIKSARALSKVNASNIRNGETFTLKAEAEERAAERLIQSVDLKRLLQNRRRSITKLVLSPDNMDEGLQAAVEVLQHTVRPHCKHCSACGSIGTRHLNVVVWVLHSRQVTRTVEGRTSQPTAASASAAESKLTAQQEEIHMLRDKVKALTKQNVLGKITKNAAQVHRQL